MPPHFRGPVADELPRRPRDTLLSGNPIRDLESAFAFLSLYPVLLHSAGMRGASPSYDFGTRSRCVHQSKESLDLAVWFREHLLARWNTALEARLSPLRRWGLSTVDIAEACLYCAMTPYGRENRFDKRDCGSLTPLIQPGCIGHVEPLEELDKYQELIDLACDWGLSAQQAKLVLKHLVPEAFDFLLDVLSDQVEVPSGVLRKRPVEQADSSLVYRWRHASQRQFLLFQWYRPHDAASRPEHALPPSNDAAKSSSVYDRVRAVREGVELCFVHGGRPLWYRVNVLRGCITPLAPSGQAAHSYHFALKRIGRACNRLNRGRRDVMLSFVRNAAGDGRHRFPAKPKSRVERQFLLEFLDEHSDRLMRKCVQHEMLWARSFTRRNAIGWEVYALVRRFGFESPEIERLRLFADTFPSLFRIVPRGFLSEIIAAGQSLREAMPYWSRSFREASRESSQNYSQAQERMMRATLLSMGAQTEWFDSVNVSDYLSKFGFFLPFVKQSRLREAFFLFMFRNLGEPARSPRQFFPLYDYVRRHEHICDRYTTLGSLQRRRAHWLQRLEEERFANMIGANKPFPAPWFSPFPDQGGKRIVYLSDPAALLAHANEQKNCAFDYASSIRAGEVQLYRLEEKSGAGLATIRVAAGKNGKRVVNERLGPCNQLLAREDAALIDKWFAEVCRA